MSCQIFPTCFCVNAKLLIKLLDPKNGEFKSRKILASSDETYGFSRSDVVEITDMRELQFLDKRLRLK